MVLIDKTFVEEKEHLTVTHQVTMKLLVHTEAGRIYVMRLVCA